MIDDNLKKHIVEVLTTRFQKHKANVLCPMCGHDDFAIAEGYFTNSIQDDLRTFKLGGPSLPTVSIVCTNCGFVSQHAAGVLGLLPKNDETQAKVDQVAKEPTAVKGGVQ